MSALGQKRTLQSMEPMSALPPKADIETQSRDVRFVPEADIVRCDEIRRYSITSSASESRLSEILTPRALAVLRLIIVSNLVGCSTGRSAGFAPLRIRA